MFSTIMSFFNGALTIFNNLTAIFIKKDMENSIKNRYEKDKIIDALENDKIINEKLEKMKKSSEELKNETEIIAEIKNSDFEKSDEEIKKELDGISNPEAKKKKTKQNEIVKTIKEKATKKQKEIENDHAFNNGEDIVFKG